MTTFRKPITQAYREILDRAPDPFGLQDWDSRMQAGLTEADMREAFLRSPEFAEKNPGGGGGGGLHPEMLLSAQGTRFALPTGEPITLRGAIPCCTHEEGEPEPEWPLVSAAYRAHVKALGNVNFFHIRLGPWRTAAPDGETHLAHIGGAYMEVGGKADLTSWNPTFWSHIDALLSSAGDAGQWVEVDVADGWGLKRAKAGIGGTYHPWSPANNMSGVDLVDNVGSVSVLAEAIWERYIRKVVEVCGRYGNVIFQLGNENSQIPGFDPIWERSMVGVIRDEEQRRGYPRHLIGTQSERSDLINDPAIDYVEMHTQGGPTPSTSKPTCVNEYNPNPSLSGAAIHAFYCQAAAAGTYYFAWRHLMTRTNWDAGLTAIKGGCSGSVCPLPDFDAPGWTLVSPKPGSQTVGQLDLSERAVIAQHPELFKPEGCLLTGGSSVPNIVLALQLVAEDMRLHGKCAWQHSDAIMALRTDGRWEELHAINWGNGCFLNPSNAYKNCFREPDAAFFDGEVLVGIPFTLDKDGRPIFESVIGRPNITALKAGANLVEDADADIVVSPIVQKKTIIVQIPVQPTVVAPPPGHRIDERFYEFTIPPGKTLVGVDTFLGLDQTNYGEYAIDVWTAEGTLYNRSMHKEAPKVMYEAWWPKQLSSKWIGQGLCFIHTLAHQTAVGSEPKVGNVQFEIKLETE